MEKLEFESTHTQYNKLRLNNSILVDIYIQD